MRNNMKTYEVILDKEKNVVTAIELTDKPLFGNFIIIDNEK